MLFINYKKHYNVPSILYMDNNYTKTRKARFFYLSDVLFKLIKYYCFRKITIYYMEYKYVRRLRYICQKHTENTYTLPLYLQKLVRLKTDEKFNDVLTEANLYKGDIKKITLFILTLTLIQKYYILFLKKCKYSLLLFVLKDKSIKKKFMYRMLRTLRNYYLKKKLIFVPNISFLLYQIIKYKQYSFKIIPISYWRLVVQYNIYITTQQLYTNIKQKNTKLWSSYNTKLTNCRKKMHNIINIKIKPKYKKYSLDSQMLELLIEKKKKIFFFFSKQLLKDLHATMATFLYAKTLKHESNNKVINYITFINLKWKKEMLFLLKQNLIQFKNETHILRNKLTSGYYKSLNYILNTNNSWFLGPLNTKKLFGYIHRLYRSIKEVYFSLIYWNHPINVNKKLSSFFTKYKIRKELVLVLGKRKYYDEFILFNNGLWFIRWYISLFFGISHKMIYKFYKRLKRQYKISKLRELLLFLEYSIKFFCKKYIHYNMFFTDLIVNSDVISEFEKDKILSIGDVIEVTPKKSNSFEKFFLFFNLFLYIDPVIYKNKLTFLLSLYKKVNNIFVNTYIFKMQNTILNKKYLSNNFFNTQLFLKKYFKVFEKIVQDTELKIKIYSFFFFKLSKYYYKYDYKSYIFNSKYMYKSFLLGRNYTKYALIKMKSTTLFKKYCRNIIRNKDNFNRMIKKRKYRSISTKLQILNIPHSVHNFFEYCRRSKYRLNYRIQKRRYKFLKNKQDERHKPSSMRRTSPLYRFEREDTILKKFYTSNKKHLSNNTIGYTRGTFSKRICRKHVYNLFFFNVNRKRV